MTHAGHGRAIEIETDEAKSWARTPSRFEHEDLRRPSKGSLRLFSPLRYPGAKRQLIPLFETLLKNYEVRTFVEPFAGGASVSLHIALNGLADRVVLGESDNAVYSFWRVACYDTAWLVDRVGEVTVSLKTWRQMRETMAASRFQRDQALACLFLNRTSFSGILHTRAGPIGGWSQESDYSLDCRFPRRELQRRIRIIGALADAGRIADVRRGDYSKSVAWAVEKFGGDNTLAYLDPPFYAKATTLYRKSFKTDDHRTLAGFLMGLKVDWLLSYDHHPVIEDLYATPLVRLPNDDSPSPRHRLTRATLRYTAYAQRSAGAELLVTSLPALPVSQEE